MNDPKENKVQYKSFAIKNLLDSVKSTDLKAFIVHYAKQDKKFQTALNVHFARNIECSDNKDKYKQILHSIIRPRTSVHDRISASQVRSLIQVVSEFGDQIDDSIALEQYRDAFDIFEPTFSMILYTKFHSNVIEDKLNEYSQHFHNYIPQFFNSKLPQALRNDILTFLKDMLNRSYFVLQNSLYSIPYLTIPFLRKDEKKEWLQLLTNKLAKSNNSEYTLLIAFIIELDGKLNDQIKSILATDPTSIREIIDILSKHGSFDNAQKLLEEWLIYKPKPNLTLYYATLIAIRRNDITIAVDKAFQLYISNQDTSLLPLLRQTVGDDSYIEFCKDLTRYYYTNSENLKNLVPLLLANQEYESLCQTLGMINEIQYTMQFANLLNEKAYTSFEDIYLSQVEAYLEVHHGESGLQWLETINILLKQQKLYKLRQATLVMLTDKFPHRSKLKETFLY